MARASEVFVVDVRDTVGAPQLLLRLPTVQAGAYPGWSLEAPIASETAGCLLCSFEEEAMLVKEGGALRVEGALTSDGGKSCVPGDPVDCVAAPKIQFRWVIPVGTLYDACPGFEVAENTTTTLQWRMRGDLWLRLGFGEGATAGGRDAQWIADADLDRDGETTLAELQQIKAAALFTPERGYDLSGAPAGLETAYDFLVAQVREMGPLNGCKKAL